MLPTRRKFTASFIAILRILQRPKYGLLAVLLSLAFFLVLRYLFSIQVLSVILASQSASLAEKFFFLLLGFIPSSLGELLSVFADPVAIMLVGVAILQGVAVTAVIFLRRHSQNYQKTKGAAGGITISLLGSGCVACGGSILYPLLASFGAQTAVGLSRAIGLVALVAALILVSYALLRLGQKASLLEREGYNQ